jgi:predicted  nucleic acid-binding Zn-ribbon protein
MANLDEPNGTPGSGDEQNGQPKPARDALEQRVRELEQENAALRGELDSLRVRHQKDRDLLDALILSGLPADEHEMQEMLANSSSLSDLLREFEERQAGTKG